MKNLADLTLTLSQELSRLEARCRRELAAADRERDRALIAGGAKSILTRYNQALEQAKQTQLRASELADKARARAILAAEDKRRRELLKEERKYRAARKRASGKKRSQVAKAERKWRDAIARAKRAPLTRQRELRKAADEALERALEEARETHTFAIEDARLAYRAGLQDDLVDERLAADQAHRKAERAITGAAIAHERELARAEANMRRELSRHPEAQSAQQVHDRKISEIRDACERDKEALFGQFTRERRRLRKPRGAKRKK